MSRHEIDEIARRYAAAQRVVFCGRWASRITCTACENVQAIANLALMRGMVGRPHAGLMPIRGHSNVQGMGSVGVTPKLKDAILERLQTHFGVQLPSRHRARHHGLHGRRGAPGSSSSGFCLGGNLYGSNPDAALRPSSLAKLDLLVYLSTTLNTGHAHGLGEETIILPVLARDEEPQPTTQESMFNFVRLSDGGPARLAGPRSEVRNRGRVGTPPAGHRRASRLGANGRDGTHPSGDRQNHSRLGKNRPDRLRPNKNSKSRGRRISEPKFPTPDGRASLHVHPLPALAGSDGQLRLMTVRSEGQFNTVVYEDYDLYRGQDRRDVVLVHPGRSERLGLSDRRSAGDGASETGVLS